MIAEMEDFKTGWHGISLRFDPKEINQLIKSLKYLRDKKCDHFHINMDCDSGDPGIADIEISLKGKNDIDNGQVM